MYSEVKIHFKNISACCLRQLIFSCFQDTQIYIYIYIYICVSLTIGLKNNIATLLTY